MNRDDMTTAQAIVWDLAGECPCGTMDEAFMWCAVCGADESDLHTPDNVDDAPLEFDFRDGAPWFPPEFQHRAGCAWKRAVEWRRAKNTRYGQPWGFLYEYC